VDIFRRIWLIFDLAEEEEVVTPHRYWRIFLFATDTTFLVFLSAAILCRHGMGVL
jgi:hypothetical protein